MERKILYVEDMEECFERTKKILGETFELDWKKGYIETIKAIYGNNFYNIAIIDVNLGWGDSNSKEGLELIPHIKTGKEGIPIIVYSINNYKEEALEKKADLFIFKKEFWEKGKQVLEELLKNTKI